MWVRTAVDEERAAALTILFNHQPKTERQICVEQALQAHESGEFTLDHLLVAGLESYIQGVCLAAIQRDRSGLIWPAVLLPHLEDNESLRDLLLREALTRFRQHRCWIGQAMVLPNATTDRERLTRNGFPFLTNLIFMERPVSDSVNGRIELMNNHQSIDSLSAVTYKPGTNDELFAAVIEDTYVDTNDCPELREVRTPMQALDSHKISGEFDPDLWKIYFENDVPIGIVLLAMHPKEELCELVYFGVCHQARGQGCGKQLMKLAIQDVQKTEAKRFFLAVDDRNSHAKSIYERFGFGVTATNAVHAYLPNSGSKVH